MATDPRWAPLLKLFPELVPDFMWMYALELEDGTILQAYKNRCTRRYLFLDSLDRAYTPLSGGSFAEGDARELLARSVGDPP